MKIFHLLLISFIAVTLCACGEDASDQNVAPVAPQVETTDTPQQVAAKPGEAPPPVSTGGVAVKILPEHPSSVGCLRAVIQGHPGRSAIIWSVNSSVVSSGTDSQLCSEHYQRDDVVTVAVGTSDVGAQASVIIGNTPPKIVDISSTPAEIYAGTDITVVPVAEDADGDLVDFTYQWRINGVEDSLLADATLPGDKFTRGDTVQVLIVPNDYFDDGPTYESFAMQIPNAAPRITSQPPQQIASLDYRYQVEVDDPDDSQFAFRLAEAPEGMVIDESTGLIQWSLSAARPGSHTIAIIATDPAGAETAQEYTLTLSKSQ